MRSMAHKGADALVIADVVYAHIHTLIPTHNYRKICIDIHIRSLCCMWVAVEATWTFRFCCFVFSSDWHHLPASKLQSNAPAAALARAGSLHHNTLRLLYCYYTHVASCIARCKYVGTYICICKYIRFVGSYCIYDGTHMYIDAVVYLYL